MHRQTRPSHSHVRRHVRRCVKNIRGGGGYGFHVWLERCCCMRDDASIMHVECRCAKRRIELNHGCHGLVVATLQEKRLFATAQIVAIGTFCLLTYSGSSRKWQCHHGTPLFDHITHRFVALSWTGRVTSGYRFSRPPAFRGDENETGRRCRTACSGVAERPELSQ